MIGALLSESPAVFPRFTNALFGAHVEAWIDANYEPFLGVFRAHYMVFCFGFLRREARRLGENLCKAGALTN